MYHKTNYNKYKGEVLIEFMIYLSVMIILFSTIYLFYLNEKRININNDECKIVARYLADNINQGYINDYYSLTLFLPNHNCKIYISGSRIGCVSDKCDYITNVIPQIELSEDVDLTQEIQLKYLRGSVLISNAKK